MIRQKTIPALLAALLVMALVGCSSEGQNAQESASTEKAASTQKQTTAGRAVEQAKIVVAELSNPKEGIDPVCGMAIDENATVVTMDDGMQYGFCSAHCAETFQEDPDKYLVASHDEGDHSGHDH
jgi:YHS domain-containing protein